MRTYAEIYADEIDKVLETVINEYLDCIPSTFVQADFEVQLLKYSMAQKNGRIDAEEMVCLVGSLCDVEKIWRKLNDVK